MLRLMSAIPLLIEALPKGTTIAFPDEGAAKRFKKSFPATFPIIVCSKVREEEKRIIRLTDKINWPTDKQQQQVALDHVCIVDDLVQTGGTLNECRLALQTAGAKTVSCYVTHCVFPNKGYTKFMEGGPYFGFRNFYTTNTISEVADEIADKKPFQVLKIQDLLVKEIRTQLKI